MPQSRASRQRADTTQARLDEQSNQIRILNDSLQRARELYTQDEDTMSQLGERSDQTEEDIVYLSREIEKLKIDSTDMRKLTKANSQASVLLTREQEHLNTQFESYKEELKELMDQRCKTGQPSNHLTNRVEISSFEGAACDKPMKYLSDLLEYFNAMGATQRMAKHVIRQSLNGLAADWWELIHDRVQTVNEFKVLFTKRYWSLQTQVKIRDDLEFGFYQAKGNLSRSKYVIRLSNQVRMLSGTPNERDTVDTFSWNFDENIQQAVITQKIVTFEGLINLLTSKIT